MSAEQNQHLEKDFGPSAENSNSNGDGANLHNTMTAEETARAAAPRP